LPSLTAASAIDALLSSLRMVPMPIASPIGRPEALLR
jgi:hypothetical protein